MHISKAMQLLFPSSSHEETVLAVALKHLSPSAATLISVVSLNLLAPALCESVRLFVFWTLIAVESSL